MMIRLNNGSEEKGCLVGGFWKDMRKDRQSTGKS